MIGTKPKILIELKNLKGKQTPTAKVYKVSTISQSVSKFETFSLETFTFFSFQVSWIRYKDTSLLTVGRYTYTTDLRFEAFHSPHTDDWIVRLKNPRPSDSGMYLCYF